MKTKRLIKIEFVLLLIVIVQVILLLNMTFAQSYIIHQTDDLIENSRIIKKEKNKFVNLISSGISLLVGFLSIKQIGFVSAQTDIGNVETYCCEDTCDITASVDGVATCSSGIEPTTTDCASIYECKIGCCYDLEEGLCTESSSLGKCTEDGGEWSDDKSCSIAKCQNGCCILKDGPSFMTEGRCDKADGVFKQIYNEIECLSFSATQFEGACIKDGACTFEAEESCLSRDGRPYIGYLCSYSILDTGCEKQVDVGCVDGKDEIYWFDSCGNRENIYNSNKEASWNSGRVLSKELSCNYGGGNTNSETCGNCARPLSKCSATGTGETNIQEGNYVCKDLRCLDAPANVGTQNRLDGESWCLYDGYIGDGKDTVGSEHWIAYCNEGIVGTKNVDNCGNSYRGKICEEQVIEEGGRKFSMASCVPNQASICITEYNPLQEEKDEEIVNNEENIQKCKDNKHCMIKNISVDDYFKFDMCVPRYPKGASLKDGVDDNLCDNIATQECTVYYKKNFFGKWKCEENCNCEKTKFAKQMNDLCISLGDCGSYINYIGSGTNNVKIEGKKGVKLDDEGEETDDTGSKVAKTPDIYSWTKYKNNSNPVFEQYVKPQDIDEFLAQLGGNGADYDPASYKNAIIWMAGIPGGLGVLAVGTSFISNLWTGTTGIFTLPTTSVGTAATVFGGFATAAVAIAIGVGIGLGLAKLFGLTNEAAILMMIAGGLAGAGVAAILLQIGISSSGVPWLAIVLIAIAVLLGLWSAITGWGEIETRIVEFTCLPWQAPKFINFNIAKSSCEQCNEDPLRPCTKYRCNSLGQTCRILNEEEENPPCNSIEYEPNPPIISPGGIITENYQFENVLTKSVEITSTERDDGCIQEFNSVYFTLKTDEPAECKWSFELPPPTYEDMQENYPFEKNAFTENHTFEIWMPSLDSPEVYDVNGDLIEMSGNMNMYVKCNDYWDNFNIDEYIVKFCINSGPDITAVNHALTTIDPKNEDTLRYDITETEMKMWINEPANCRYDTVPGKDYEDMSYEMSCYTSIRRPNVFGWPCSTILKDLVGGENKFYFKCKDKPWADTSEERNVNKEDYEYKLHVSSNELKIDSVSFSTTVLDKKIGISSGETFDVGGVKYISVDMEVKTSGGMDNGKSNCYWGVLEDGKRDLMSPYYTLTNVHTQLFTPRFPATHTNYITCEDDAGNNANVTTQFTITIDSKWPEVVRTYYENGKLNLVTDEIAQCYYDFDICGFSINNETIKFDSVGYSTEHKTDWITGQTYNVKCSDIWGNINPNGCDIRIIPSI
jgi:hypothetical protein